MQGEPTPNLVALLGRLKLATREQILGVAPYARRLAGDLPDFEPVWVDALAQARILTPLQAAEINAGRGDALLQGPYLIARKLSGPGYADCYAAIHRETRKVVRLYVVRHLQSPVAPLARELAAWVEASRTLGAARCVVEDAGAHGENVWAACAPVEGTVAADWMVENGRFPPNVVLEIARQMAACLAELEHHRLVHGDLSAAAVVLQPSGRVALPMPGLRGIVRPSEGYSFCDLPPEALDSLSPERIADGSPTSTSSDIFACGSLWWRLLTGRSAFAGGNSLLKLKAIHASKLPDVRSYAPNVPELLAQAIDRTTAREPAERPASFAELVELLGPASRSAAAQLARCVSRPTQVWHAPRRRNRQRAATHGSRTLLHTAVAAGALVAVASLGVAVQQATRYRSQQANIAAAAPPSRTAADSSTMNTPGPPAAVPKSPAEPSPVRQASAHGPLATSGPEPLILPSGKTVLQRGLALKPGQTVRGRADQRPVISVPRDGLRITSDDVRFERIDFVWEHEPDRSARGRHAAMIVVETQTVEFLNCSFSASGEGHAAAVAMAGGSNPLLAAGGDVSFSDCVFRNTSAIVDCLSAPSLAVQLNNSLSLSAGPMLRLHRPPTADQAVTLSLDHVTARGDSPAIECRVAADTPGGPVSVTATDCVFDTGRKSGLLVFLGVRPKQLFGSFSWTGHGSLITPHSEMALWQAANRSLQPLEEETFDIAGLVRCQVQFAGAIDAPPGASRITRWQGPLRSAEAPGARVHALAVVASKPARPAAESQPKK